jgi:ABC-2 type transport system ATP-binding protein
VQIMHHGKVVYSDTIAALKALHSGQSVVVGLRRPPPDPELRKTPGVVDVQEVGAGMYRMQIASQDDGPEALATWCVQRGWGLYHLAPSHTLEDVFVSLTK